MLVFCGDLVYKFKRIVGKPNFSVLFEQIIKNIKKEDTTWISCDSLHVRWFIAMISSLIAR